MKYFLIAGEASGDLHAGRLIDALRREDGEASFCYLGGDCMQAASGVAPVVHYREMAYMAFSEVLRHLPDIFKNMRIAKESIARFAPDAIVLVDYPSFNLKIAKYAWRKGIPVYYYISPKIWAWKTWRVKQIKKYVRKVFSILPFETEFYAKYGYAVDYAGNPTVGEIADARRALPSEEEFRKLAGVSADVPLIALLPGSRIGEIRNNLPLMADAARRFAGFQAVVAAAPGIETDFYRTVCPDGICIVRDATYALLAYSKAAVVTSGTATLETAIMGTPQVVCYRGNGSSMTYALFKRILKVRYVSLPNLIAGKEVVPELLLHQCTADGMAKSLRPLLGDTAERRAMEEGYALVAQRLGKMDCAKTTARQLFNDLTNGAGRH